MDPTLDLSLEERRRILDEAFKALVVTTSPPPLSAPESNDVNFVKSAITPQIQITSADSILKALALSEKGLIGQFIGIWPSPKTMGV